MPHDRLRSPRAGHGRKTTALTDFEYRVWDQFQLSADDFGVMPFSAYSIQAGNYNLARRNPKDIQRALERLALIGLALKFEHQGQPFLCDPTWQDFQHIKHPRKTILPKPPGDALQRSTPPTRKLFAKHPGGKSGSGSDRLRIGRGSGDDHQPPRARETAIATATANGTQLEAQSDTDLADRFVRFWNAYPLKVAKPRAERSFRKLAPDEPLLEQILVAIDRQRRSREWRKEGGEYIPHPSTWLNNRRWEDEVRLPPGSVATLAGSDWRDECEQIHGGRCGNPTMHAARVDDEAEKAATRV
jgi:hypothetical protein